MTKKGGEPQGTNELSTMSPEMESALDTAFAEGDKGDVSEKAKPPEEKPPENEPEKDLNKSGDKEDAVKPKDEIDSDKPEDFEHKYKTLQGIFSKEKEEKDTLKGKLDEMQTKMADIERLQEGTRKEKAEAEKKKGELEDTLFDLYADLTPEEKAELATYDEEFDVVSKTESKKRTLFEKKMKAYIANMVETSNKSLLTNLAPFLMASEKSSEEAHFSAIKGQHQDFEKYRDDGSLKKWIDEQPGYLKKEMQRVYSEGEAADVIDLFSRFKKDNNIGTPGDKDLSRDIEKKKKLDNMEMVDTGKRVIGSSGGVGKNQDYDSAWDEAAAKVSK